MINWRFFVLPLCSWAKLLHSCPTLCSPMDCSPQGSSVHGILQARIVKWAATPSSRGSSWPRDQTHVSYIPCIGRSFTTSAATCARYFICIIQFNPHNSRMGLLQMKKLRLGEVGHPRTLPPINVTARIWRRAWQTPESTPLTTVGCIYCLSLRWDLIPERKIESSQWSPLQNLPLRLLLK